ncbi:MAG TPA: hypothetical protein VJT67_09900 [Longimicrobiaceae bacterium]|nr:hypothetical protein [Longimicrobiaceae bacterium]
MKPSDGLFLAACALILSLPVHGQSYELRGRQQIGQGLARPRGAGECLIVAPLHVVADNPSITATGESNAPAEVRVIRQYDGADIAILQFTGTRTVNCPAWKTPTDLSARLADASVNAVLRVRNADAISSIPVWIRRVDAEYVTITPRLPDDHFAAGMSGGQLLVEGVFAGILLSTEPVRSDSRGASESVRVLRSDVLDRLISGFFTGTPVEGIGNRPPAPLGVPSNEPDLWLRIGQSVVLGDKNTGFGMLRDWGRGNIDVIFNGGVRGMSPGTRFEFPDSRGQCVIIYLRTEPDGRAAFAIRCSPAVPQ